MGKKSHNNKQNNVIKIENSIDDEAKNILDKISKQSLINTKETEDKDNFDDLIKLFNANQLKKTMQRILKSNQLLDKITEQALNRFINNPDEYTNQDLLNYMKVIQDSIINSQKTLSTQQEQLNKPLIQINQTVNKNEIEITQESRNKILSVVNEFIKLMNNQENSEILEGEITEMKGDKNE